MSRIVVALGGNALGKNPLDQLKLVNKTAKQIVKIVEDGNEVIVVHGNGPQVGMINLAFDFACANGETAAMPFAECGAMSQGYIGYHLQQSIDRELRNRQIDKKAVTIITQVEVDKKDTAFDNPTKPVGMFYSGDEADKISKEKGYIFTEDAGRGFRRVVPSPKPISILEQKIIEKLVRSGNIVIACGGGGIPVIKDGSGYKGVDAVIDKDYAASKLATILKADILLILTAVDRVYINYTKPNRIPLKKMYLEEAKEYIKQGYFASGSMLPKVEASISFVESRPKGLAIISSLNKGLLALQGKTGTRIEMGGKLVK